MALLDANLYHMPCHMTRVLDWGLHSSLRQWVQVEQVLAGNPLETVPWRLTDLPCQLLDHPTVGEKRRICMKRFRDLCRANAFAAHPIVGNPAFSPGLDSRF